MEKIITHRIKLNGIKKDFRSLDMFWKDSIALINMSHGFYGRVVSYSFLDDYEFVEFKINLYNGDLGSEKAIVDDLEYSNRVLTMRCSCDNISAWQKLLLKLKTIYKSE